MSFPDKILLLIIYFFTWVASYAQPQLSRLEYAFSATVHAPVQPNSDGADVIHFYPSPGWKADMFYNIVLREDDEFGVYGTLGSTGVMARITLPADQYLQKEYDAKVWARQPYTALGLTYHFEKSGMTLIGGIGNRFYLGASTGWGISVPDSLGGHLTIFRFKTFRTRPRFCPELNLAISGPIFQKWPSWNYFVTGSYCPRQALYGDYIYSSGSTIVAKRNFALQQSYLGLGIRFRRVRM
ncbi:MAG TPA: hypothetical protein VI731_06840 [Bacteroidia bacterium]|nr:hypothetical protein [Bacteroidia bacterium]